MTLIIKRDYTGFRTLRKQAESTKKWDRLVYSPTALIDSAENNANDTVTELYRCYVPQESSAWQGFFWSSLLSLLTSSEVSNDVRKWFVKRGIEG